MSASAFFNANNNQGDVLNVVTTSSSATTFDPAIVLYSTKLGRWDFGDGVAQATNSPSYTYSDSGITKNVKFSIDRFSNVAQVTMNGDNIGGSLDFSKFTRCIGGFTANSNPLLTGITFPSTTENINGVILFSCDITGELDLSVMTNLHGAVNLSFNPNLTGLTILPSSTKSFTSFQAPQCDIYGRLDFSGYTGGFGGQIDFSNNVNLTGLTFPSNSDNITTFNLNSVGLTEPLDLSILSGFGGSIQMSALDCPTITFPSNSNNITLFAINANNNIIDYNISGLTGLGGSVNIQGHPSLTGITIPASSNSITSLAFNGNTVLKNLDLSPLSGINGNIYITASPSFSGVTFPFVNTSVSQLHLNNCKFDSYIDCTRLSASTNHGFYTRLDQNSVPTSGINHMLYDFDNFGWTGGTFISTGGLNGAPDGSSGGYNGTGATANLLLKGWTVTTN